jgi:osmoprotectant transport system permease protein
MKWIGWCLLWLCFAGRVGAEGPTVKVGSKKFTESVVVGELLVHLASSSGAEVTHQKEMGGTRILWNALLSGDIDIYPEYTGTITQEILAGKGIAGLPQIRQALAEQGIGMSLPLGFNNTYAIGIKEELAVRLDIAKISDLVRHPELRFGFGNEFMERGDGWPGLRDRYGLPQRKVRGLSRFAKRRYRRDGSLLDRRRDQTLQPSRLGR